LSVRKLIFIHSGHHNDVIVCDNMRAVESSLAIEIIECNMGKPADLDAFVKSVQKHAEDVFAVMGLNTTIVKQLYDSGVAIHEALHVPLVIFVMDHPAHFVQEFLEDKVNTLYVFGSPEHEKFWTRFCPGQNKTCNVQIGGWSPRVIPEDSSYEAFLARENHVFIPLNLRMRGADFDNWLEFAKKKPAPVQEVVELAFAMISTKLDMNVDVAIDNALADKSIELNRSDRIDASFIVDSIAKMWRRNFLIGSIIDLPVIVSSENIPAALANQFSEKFVNTKGYDTIRLFNRFRFVLNASPPTPNMVHDRINNCINSEAALITEASPGICKFLVPGKDFIAYEYDRDSIRGQIIEAMDDPRSAYEMTISAKENWNRQELNFRPLKELMDKIDLMRRNIQVADAVS